MPFAQQCLMCLPGEMDLTLAWLNTPFRWFGPRLSYLPSPQVHPPESLYHPSLTQASPPYRRPFFPSPRLNALLPPPDGRRPIQLQATLYRLEGMENDRRLCHLLHRALARETDRSGPWYLLPGGYHGLVVAISCDG